ncbi:hypothetical protein AB0J80_20605 [Actinoplanes sp. NPDC049548]|uniref:hypothetical protein n=1 Tax=Actinoplanes sp. NPDC049548 TaxID=3155152 RepID=UPI003419394C
MLIKGWGLLAAVVVGSAAALAVPVAAVAAAEPATLTLSAPNSAARLGSVTLTGTFSAGPATLTVTRKDLAGTHTLPEVVSGAAGDFVVHDKPPVGGTNTYTVSWAGDDTTGAASVQAQVAVTRRTPKLTISTNASVFAYHGKATITARLGTTHDSRAVCIWATPRGGTKTKVKCGTGTVTAAYAPTRRTTFSATFAGDQWYAPVSTTRTVTARARIDSVLDDYYGTSGKDKLYHASVDPFLIAMVSPSHAYGCINFEAQGYYQRKWWSLPTARCVPLNGDSMGGGKIFGTHVAGTRYRMRATFSGDTLNAAAAGSWHYLRFTK